MIKDGLEHANEGEQPLTVVQTEHLFMNDLKTVRRKVHLRMLIRKMG